MLWKIKYLLFPDEYSDCHTMKCSLTKQNMAIYAAVVVVTMLAVAHYVNAEDTNGYFRRPFRCSRPFRSDGHGTSATPSCPRNMVYMNCTTNCKKTCQNPTKVMIGCNNKCSEPGGCICPEGFLLKGENDCVIPEDCGCFISEIGVLMENKIYINENCTERCVCNSIAEITCDHGYECDGNATCDLREGNRRCYCNDGFAGDGDNCTQLPIDCQYQILLAGYTQDGVYTVRPLNSTRLPLEAYCNMTLDGGGLTILNYSACPAMGCDVVAVPMLVCGLRWETPMRWCHTVNQLFQGDFNGDGRTDLLCHNPITGYKWIIFANENNEFVAPIDWQTTQGWCGHNTAELHIGDFNGDGRSDMLCHDIGNGNKWMALANSDGNFVGTTSWSVSLVWCYGNAAQVFIGDFNGDGRDDILCHLTTTGYKMIAYAQSDGTFSGTDWKMSLSWCNGSDRQIFIGDFNGDSRSDLLCHSGSNGYMWIAFATTEGNFNDSTGWEADLGWCFQNNTQLFIGDINGDGKDDLLCHNSGNGYIVVAITNCDSNFNGGTSWENDLGWCFHHTAEFFLGDYNRDSKTDLFCHDKGNGSNWIIYADPFYVSYGIYPDPQK